MGFGVKLAFIGGTGRCGTSITRKLLACSPEVGVLPFEHRILIDPDGPIDFYDRMKSYRDPYSTDIAIDRLIRHLARLDESTLVKKVADKLIKTTVLANYLTPSQYSGWQLSETFTNYQVEVEKLQCVLNSFRYIGRWVGSQSYKLNNYIKYSPASNIEELGGALRDFYISLVSDFLSRNSKSYFVEDSTWNMNHIGSLAELFPEAKFVHVYRDPRDVVASLMGQNWMPDDVLKVIKIYQDLITNILEKTEARSDCYPLKFEALVENRESELLGLCAHLELDYVDTMGVFHLNRANIGRFRHEFDQKTVQMLNEMLAPQLEVLGYVR
jgi:hypothetical protein